MYTVLYKAVPVFSWMRAPERFGLLVDFGLSVLAGVGLAVLFERRRRADLAAAVVTALVVAELIVPFSWPKAPAVEPVYPVLALQPPGPVIEMPFYYREVGLFRHAQYMLKSTTHWMPLVNGYSDYIPPDFLANVRAIASFPSADSLRILAPLRVRYAVFHMNHYNAKNRIEVAARLNRFAPYLRPLYIDETLRLYEIVSLPASMPEP